MGTFSLAWQTFHLPKKGHASEDYEDAFAGDPDRARFAVADGASESLFAGAWASALVESFVQIPGPWSAWLPMARARWCAHGRQPELPWYAETKLEEGDFAAFLGIAFTGDRWLAEAVGDCCLFRVRGRRLLQPFPIRRSSDFGNRPSLLGSRRPKRSQTRARRFRLQGDRRPGDVFYLMTDALAQWFLKSDEEGRRPLKLLEERSVEGEFAPWVENLRESGELRNDDVTLMRISPEDS
jgi:hypothetical protein